MAPHFLKDERVLCFHQDLLYEAKILDCKAEDPQDSKGPMLYLVHYKGWKKTWDDWVSDDRLRKHTPENLLLAAELLRNKSRPAKKSHKKKVHAAPATTTAARSDRSSARNSEDRESPQTESSVGPRKRSREDDELEKERAYLRRPSLRPFPIPWQIQGLLVDDWEYVTKDSQLVPLPSERPVRAVMEAYYADESAKRIPGSPAADLLEEFVRDYTSYFASQLGKCLLYRFEREQFVEMYKLWSGSESGQSQYKDAADVYGAEHLIRLIVVMPEQVAESDMDDKTISKLWMELLKLVVWLDHHASTYFSTEYVDTSREYKEKSKVTYPE
ncbi:MAG: Esa1p-associated factor [Phylliscum demangeonii]|nr:MAG: Esa1p-associated factor [Phylliscum demangeonii]